ncbi:glycoside hydrolase family 2 protein [Microbacterium deminutum]
MIDRTPLHEGWTLRLANGASDSVVPAAVREALPIAATVPGTVHTDLLTAGLIPDPYLDRNEDLVSWIGWVDWVYERSLDIVDPRRRRVLHFDGLDTVATVTVNEPVVLRSENQHRRYDVDVTDALHHGPNTLRVEFASATAFGEAERARLGAYPSQYPAPFNYMRKSACNFGWDWGPSLVTAGIWRDVLLVTGDEPRLGDVRPTLTVEGDRGHAVFEVDITGTDTDTGEEHIVVEITLGDARVSRVVEPGVLSVRMAIDLDGVRRWWPAGLGEAALYDASVRLCTESGDLHDQWRERLGFRSVRLDTAPDAEGTPFTLVVNDIPVPVRGANWIPDDCFLPRVDASRLQARIGQALGAHINLLRVWGGGVYESREFYRACDEAGMLVWQDFLFACAAYPEEDRLATEIRAEARDNVARLMPHPSLVLWNGNNENFWGMLDWDWRETLGGRPWGAGYYLEMLPEAVAAVDPSRPYWPGSPYSGDPAIHPNDDDHGPKHIWDVWNEVDYSVYAHYRPRFVAEFGWQGPPTWSTMTRAIHDDPLTPESPGMLAHQKANDGAGKLRRGLEPHLPAPETTEDWHFATQLNQARAVAFGIEHFRSLRPRCSGTIVWQLNDCWPVTSWAAIDGDGRRKPLWYALRNAYAPRLLTLQPRGEDGALALVAVNDERDEWDLDVVVRRLSFDGKVLAEEPLRVEVEPLGVATLTLPAEVCVATDPHAEILVALEPGGTAVAHRFFAVDRDLDLTEPALRTSLRRDGETVVLTLAADTVVRDVCIFADRISPAAESDDALLTLLPGESRDIRVIGVPEGREQELAAAPILRTVNSYLRASRSPRSP